MTSEADTDISPGTVVVGLDWSHGARAAIDHAVRDAARRGVDVDVVTVFEPLRAWAWAYLGVDDLTADDEAARQSARGVVAEVAGNVETELGAGSPTITVHVRHGRPGEVLVDAARDAALLVVGHRGRGPATTAILGSVGLHCVLHASCPVTVVRPTTTDRDDA